ncbi:hypothetical protein OB910_22650 [Klebsiella pneumoniae]|nr:hypothetical protein [Klebsiella pneumoniae]
MLILFIEAPEIRIIDYFSAKNGGLVVEHSLVRSEFKLGKRGHKKAVAQTATA